MEVFWGLFAYIIVVNLLFSGSKTPKGRLYQCLLTGIALFLVLALKSPECGIDILNRGFGYWYQFGEIGKASWGEVLTPWAFTNYEVGFMVFNKLVYTITPNPYMYIAITALINVGLVTYVIYKYSSNVLLSFIVYACMGLYIASFCILRQTLAFSFTFLAFHYLCNGKNFPFFISVAVATSMHTSAFIFFFAWPLWDVRLSRKRLLVILLAFLFIIPFLREITSYLVLLFFENRYRHYQNEGGAVTLFLIYLFLLALSLFIHPNYRKVGDKVPGMEDKRFNFYTWMILFAVASQSLGLIGNGAITRIGYFFSIFFCLYLPEILNGLGKSARIPTLIGSSALLILFFYLTTKGGYLDVVPYHFFWESGHSIY